MISEAELAQMKERPPLYKDTLSLIREVEELRAALRECNDLSKAQWHLHADLLRRLTYIGSIARAALGEKP